MIRDVFENISDVKKANDVSLNGAAAAGLVAVFTIAFVIFGKANPTALVDVGLFAVVCWRICKMSRAWAVVGFLLFLVEKWWQFSKGPVPSSAWVWIVLIGCGFIGGIRGTFAFHKLQQHTSQSTEGGASA
jgi:hypothetical protein